VWAVVASSMCAYCAHTSVGYFRQRSFELSLISEASPSSSERSLLSTTQVLNGMLGAWGFEPQAPTVSSSALGHSTSIDCNTYRIAQQTSLCMHCIHCFKCSFRTFLCAKLCAHILPSLSAIATPKLTYPNLSGCTANNLHTGKTNLVI